MREQALRERTSIRRRTRRLLRPSAIPWWLLLGWNVVKGGGDIDFIVDAWGWGGDSVTDFLGDWGWVFALAGLAYLIVGTPGVQSVRNLLSKAAETADDMRVEGTRVEVPSAEPFQFTPESIVLDRPQIDLAGLWKSEPFFTVKVNARSVAWPAEITGIDGRIRVNFNGSDEQLHQPRHFKGPVRLGNAGDYRTIEFDQPVTDSLAGNLTRGTGGLHSASDIVRFSFDGLTFEGTVDGPNGRTAIKDGYVRLPSLLVRGPVNDKDAASRLQPWETIFADHQIYDSHGRQRPPASGQREDEKQEWRAAGRSLTTPQAGQLINKLAEFAGTPYEIWWRREDTEAEQFAMDISRAAKTAGWSRKDETPVGHLELERGTFVSFHDQALRQAAMVLREELAEAGFACSVALGDWHDPATIGVIVWESERSSP